ncbi:MAG: hypothetical protein GTO67_10985 [Gammaproteobacteria bacterium]|nr:hypothetical protein [Gammaproteobacteria bacterium]NIM72221.1 hypothetical protein [Gammaproteobacteria bacterium]NIN39136.1 hypothetical protein [Gammaproteobacteria bacterium]NIO23969.1 hypothetical protein [Gammaproteobacteria bacterium]NIO64621.1 hypothetical protein [Gammaproteobacteria bacterium]
MPGKTPRPQDTAPLEPSEFGIAFQIALDAGQNPSGKTSSTPWERARFALEHHFAGETQKFESADTRFRAVMDLYRRNGLADWIRGGDQASQRIEIHPAVLDVASRMRLARNGRFPLRKFLEQVSVTARENYSDLEEWPMEDAD